MQAIEVVKTDLVKSSVLFRQEALAHLAGAEGPIETHGNRFAGIRHRVPKATRVGKDLVVIPVYVEAPSGVVTQNVGVCRRSDAFAIEC